MAIDSSMTVRELMTENVEVLQASDRLDLADAIMRLQRFRHLPVVEGGRLVGIVSSRDILRAQASNVHSNLTPEQLERAYHKIAVGEIMTRNLATISPDDTARRAAEVLRARKIGCLPVLEQEKIVGIITETDFLKIFIDSID